MGTQWRTTFGGASGLDYNVLFRLMDDEGLSREEQRLMLDDIQILEAQAMKTMQGG